MVKYIIGEYHRIGGSKGNHSGRDLATNFGRGTKIGGTVSGSDSISGNESVVTRHAYNFYLIPPPTVLRAQMPPFLSSKKSKEKRKQEKEQLRRLYLSYHHHNPTDSDPSPFNFCLVLSPKTPSPEEANACTRWRISRQESLVGDDGNVGLEWMVDRDTSSTRALRVMGLLLLTRVDDDVSVESIDNVLRHVEVPHVELVWKPEMWMLGALRVSRSFLGSEWVSMERFALLLEILPRSFISFSTENPALVCHRRCNPRLSSPLNPSRKQF